MKGKKRKEKLFNLFIGVDTNRDEYQLQEIRHILANIAIGLSISNMLLLCILIIVDQVNQATSVGTVGLSIINIISTIYFYIKIGRKGLNETEFTTEEELNQFKKRALYRSLIQGGFLGILVYFITSILLPFILSETFKLNLIDLLKIVVFGTIFIGSILYLIVCLRLKKYEAD